MTAFKPTDVKREEFRKYLERSGVMDTLTKILVNLYEESEKPADALSYLRNKLSLTAGDPNDTIEGLRERIENCLLHLQRFEMEIAQLKGVQYVPTNPSQFTLQPPPPPSTNQKSDVPPPTDGSVTVDQESTTK
ncbi:c-Myc-binding protein isoform X2 [Chrysoperla carnea]|uniref:c-Myc-binding protein isoform X2 n=1 Tax=Chrysoperla carnea TaxID=189513 RepID=UPI001D0773EC|nr:c-Myc-binding protein isoform X2 [Chrysoperla carnea]